MLVDEQIGAIIERNTYRKLNQRREELFRRYAMTEVGKQLCIYPEGALKCSPCGDDIGWIIVKLVCLCVYSHRVKRILLLK